MPQPGSRPSSLHELRLPFAFVPHGAPLQLEWMAEHPGWVKFPATFVPRTGTGPSEESASTPDRPDPPQALTGDFFSQAAPAPPASRHMAVPRIVKPAPLRPRLPAHPPPPTAYTGPQPLLAEATSAMGTARCTALIRSALAILDAVAGRAATGRDTTIIRQPINYSTSNVTSSTARALNMSRNQLREAIHRLKRGVNLGPNDNVIIHIPSGDVYFNNEPIGNLRDEY